MTKCYTPVFICLSTFWTKFFMTRKWMSTIETFRIINNDLLFFSLNKFDIVVIIDCFSKIRTLKSSKLFLCSFLLLRIKNTSAYTNYTIVVFSKWRIIHQHCIFVFCLVKRTTYFSKIEQVVHFFCNKTIVVKPLF